MQVVRKCDIDGALKDAGIDAPYLYTVLDLKEEKTNGCGQGVRCYMPASPFCNSHDWQLPWALTAGLKQSRGGYNVYDSDYEPLVNAFRTSAAAQPGAASASAAAAAASARSPPTTSASDAAPPVAATGADETTDSSHAAAAAAAPPQSAASAAVPKGDVKLVRSVVCGANTFKPVNWRSTVAASKKAGRQDDCIGK